MKLNVYLCKFKSSDSGQLTTKMSEKRTNQRRVAGSYFMSLMSITLVLFLLGLFSLLMMHAQKLSHHLKENIGFEIVMNSNVKESSILLFQKELDAMPAVKSTEYIAKEEAIRRLSDDLGEDFLQWLGDEDNPLLPSIDVHFNAPWANPDSLNIIKAQLVKNTIIKEIHYQESHVNIINQNINRIGLVLIIVCLVLLIIAITLIRNTIRLRIYSNRFLVRSMQLVGATPGFIRRPFVRKGIFQGFIGALLADALLALLFYTLTRRMPELMLVQDYAIIAAIFVGIVLLGMMLGGISTRSALRKYLNADVDRLYA